MTFGVDSDFGYESHALTEARWERVEYPAILRRAREADRKHLERHAKAVGMDVLTFTREVEKRLEELK